MSSSRDEPGEQSSREDPRKDLQGPGQIGEGGSGSGSGNVSPSGGRGAAGNDGKGKEKKRVGFLGDHQREPSEDYFSFPGTPGSTPSGANTPGRGEQLTREELSAALQKILGAEQRQSPSPRGLQVPVPPRPRPVLRKQATQERQDPVDMVAGSPGHPHRSEVEARDRADRLASALSSRNSWQADGGSSHPLRRNMSGHDDRDSLETEENMGLRLRRRSQQAATELVRSHSRRQRESSPQRDRDDEGFHSGQMTPIAPDVEYVPRPNTYRGGILALLLKLQNNADDRSGPGSSVASTPASSPPASGASTPVGRPGRQGRPGERPTGGLFGLRGHHTTSGSATPTLSNLIGSSSAMFTAPGVASENLAEKLRDLRGRSQSPGARKAHKKKSKAAAKRARKEDELRITVHIAEIISRCRYLVKLCRGLMMYGAPTHRLEAYMSMSARVLGIEGQFLYLPGCMVISFVDSSTHTTEVHIVRTSQGVDLGKLRDVHHIYKEVVHDLIGVDEATERLDEVFSRKNKFAPLLRVFVFGLASVCVAPFAFEGRLIDLPIAFILGCIVGLLQLIFAPSNELYANVFEITATVITSFLARAFGSIRGGRLFCFSALAQSSIALILPGYTVLSASLELQSRQIVSGSVRMVYAMIYSLVLGYGITIGSVLYGYIDKDATSSIHCSNPLSNNRNWSLLFVPLFTLCLCVVNQAKWKQMPVMIGISLAGYCVNSYSSSYFRGNVQISNTLGALSVGVMANLYSRLSRHVENFCLDVWEFHLEPRLTRRGRLRRAKSHSSSDSGYPLGPYTSDSQADPETAAASDHHHQKQQQQHDKHGAPRLQRQVGYALAAAAMLPAIFVQVPSGLAAGGSLLSGVNSANQITGNSTTSASVPSPTSSNQSPDPSTDLNGTAFNVLLSVIQVAIGISVGLSLSALIVYPFGKRRSGLFSF